MDWHDSQAKVAEKAVCGKVWTGLEFSEDLEAEFSQAN